MLSYPLTIDLVTQRFVYPNDLNIGVRQIGFEKGNTYNVGLSFVNGLSGITPPLSGFVWSLSAPNKKTSPIITSSGISSSGTFPFVCASPVLDYAIDGSDSIALESDVIFQSQGINYTIATLNTIVTNNPSLSAPQQYYPLHDNPAGYITATGIPALTGNYYPASNPSGFITGNFYPSNNPSGFINGSGVVHLTGNETISGTKTFSNDVQVEGNGSFVSGLINFGAGGSATFANGAIGFAGDGTAYFVSSDISFGAGGSASLANGRIAINADGSASFVAGAILLNNDGSVQFGSSDIFVVDSGGNLHIGDSCNVNQLNWTIANDGSASFAGGGILLNANASLNVIGSYSYTTNILYAENQSDSAYCKLQSDVANGAAAFIFANSNNGQSWNFGLGAATGSTALEFFDAANNVWQIVAQPGGSVLFFPSYAGGGSYSAPMASINNDGSASFNGNVSVANSFWATSLNTDGSISLGYSSSAPSSPVAGQIYFSQDDSHFYGWNGSAWVQLDNG